MYYDEDVMDAYSLPDFPDEDYLDSYKLPKMNWTGVIIAAVLVIAGIVVGWFLHKKYGKSENKV